MKGEEAAVLRAFARVKTTMPERAARSSRRAIPSASPKSSGCAREEGFVDRARGPSCRSTPSRAPTSSSSTRIGELAQLYQIATVVFVGGSLVPTGGHNILEPAVFGKPIVFGPHMQNFSEIADAFLANGAAVQVQSERELEEALLSADDRSGAARAARRGGARAGRGQSRRQGQDARRHRRAAAAAATAPAAVVRPFRLVH